MTPPLVLGFFEQKLFLFSAFGKVFVQIWEIMQSFYEMNIFLQQRIFWQAM